MKYSKLGETGILVSRLGLGTVELGLNYGINEPDNFGKPDDEYSIHLLHKAADAGINLFDTAPSYGCSEELLGKAFANRKNCVIATKVNIPPEGVAVEKFILSSLTQSHQKLRREHLDIVQLHNATSETFARSDIFEVLQREKDKGNIRCLGASVYEPESALAAIDSGMIDVLQIAYSVLDQRMAEKVLDKAESEGIGILSRSVYLKGVLTEKAKWLPERCAPLRKAVESTKKKMNLTSWNDLSGFALRFALSNSQIKSVLVGVRSEAELDFALDAVNKGKLSDDELELASQCRMNDKFWLNPSNWGID
jgi:aryl-alcohol dehydrogenase-like predicted oxidoreductase